MRILAAIFVLFFACSVHQPACDYVVADLKNFLSDVRTDGQDLSSEAGFAFPYQYPYADFADDLTAWLGGDGTAFVAVNTEGGIEIRIEQTNRMFEFVTVAGDVSGTPSAEFAFTQSNCN